MYKVFILSFLLAVAALPYQLAAQGRPNVILIMTDDQGYGELSVHGNPILKTPFLDQLHDESIRFTDFHVAPMCTPTRGQLMTGLDAARNGAVNVSSGRTLLRKELKTMADYFLENGYHTGIFGKWHLGDNYPYRPEDRGFQETLWFPSSHVGSVPDYWGNNYFDDVYIKNGEREKVTGYCTDVFFSRAMDWMRECAGKSEPFFTYLPTNAAHAPHYAPEADIEAMRRVVERSNYSTLEPSVKNELIRYLAMIRNIDSNVGRLIDFLDHSGLTKNTILIFLTDNGSTFGPQYYNAGMRGRKTQLWEGGHRVPLFIRWPDGGFTDPRDIDELTQVQDLLPTLLDLCNIKEDEPAFDGVSLAPALRGARDVEDRLLVINYSRMPHQFEFPSPYTTSLMTKEGAAVLWKKWRLLHGTELYDLKEDPMQETNVIEKYADVASYMNGYLDKWWAEVADKANVPQRVIIGSEHENPSLISACEWMDVFVDQQSQVNRGVLKNSYWLLEVARKGTYEFELRRWPKESNLGLKDGNGKEGVALPIAAARLMITGSGNNIMMRKEIGEKDQSVVFTVELAPGPITMHTWFDQATREAVAGAYYVYVSRK